jgi:hypothetical protein
MRYSGIWNLLSPLLKSGWQHYRTEDIFFPNAITRPYRICGPPSWLWLKCNQVLRLRRPQGTVTLPRWCERWYVWAWSTRRSLKPKLYKLPRPWSLWGTSLQGKIPTAEPGIEPGTSWIVVRSSNHQATRLVTVQNIQNPAFPNNYGQSQSIKALLS